MLKTNDMVRTFRHFTYNSKSRQISQSQLGENDLIDVEKFEQSLKASKKIPDDVLPKLKTVADKCKDHRHNSAQE